MFAIRPLRACVVVIALGFCWTGRPGAFATDAIDAQKLYRQNIAGTVLIIVNDGLGSGWVIDRERRLVVTNCHVVDKDERPYVVFPKVRNGRVIAERAYYVQKKEYVVGTVVLRDKNRDLAIVSLPRLPAGVTPLPLAPDAAMPGQRVHAIGNPGSCPALWVYSTGTVRAVFTDSTNGNDTRGVCMIVTRVPLNPGDSGGPMFDDEGRVIGVSVAVARNAHLMSLAIDVSEVRAVYQSYAQQVDENATR